MYTIMSQIDFFKLCGRASANVKDVHFAEKK